MHAVVLLEQAIAYAQRTGYQVRQEWLGGVSGGRCEFAGQRWIFVDLSLDPLEQLEQVIQGIEPIHGNPSESIPAALQTHLDRRRAA